ncbi:hypothetical protein AC578_10134 [Pseudocercospora eumusae]|uniref:Methyltransferase domain-containing protein n=1 Tax=Pseudocercospora eumusae TaxID=321146 RepID=A0A139HYH0_9PEZI|nr:hypothetical protein AC578_10134 [Pseudocercospora eumusae]
MTVITCKPAAHHSENVMTTPQPEDNQVVAAYGRNYARFSLEHKIHCVPVDDDEEQNYDSVNDILRQLLGGPVRGVILPRMRLNRDAEVLDCGYGKGAWIDSVLNLAPDALCTGVDIFTGVGDHEVDNDDDDEANKDEAESGIEIFTKKRWNLNAPFRDDRSEDRLTPLTFDLINSRLLADGIDSTRWPSFVRDLHALLKPDGWVQMVEFHSMFQSSTGRPTVFLQEWWNRYARMLQVTRKDPRVGPRLRQLMDDAGFVDIQYHQIPCPMGSWDEDRAVLGRQALPVCQEMLRDVSEYLFKAVGRMNDSEFDTLIKGAQAELARPELRIYLNVHVCIGRKAPRRK